MYVAESSPEPIDFSTKDANDSEALAMSFISLNGTGKPANADIYNDFYSNLKVVFQNTLSYQMPKMNIAIMTEIDATYNVTADIDPEVKGHWYPTGIALNYTPVFEPAHQFVSSMGRLLYLTPIYTALNDNGHHDTAVQWFNENKDFYHPLAVSSLETLLDIPTVHS